MLAFTLKLDKSLCVFTVHKGNIKELLGAGPRWYQLAQAWKLCSSWKTHNLLFTHPCPCTQTQITFCNRFIFCSESSFWPTNAQITFFISRDELQVLRGQILYLWHYGLYIQMEAVTMESTIVTPNQSPIAVLAWTWFCWKLVPVERMFFLPIEPSVCSWGGRLISSILLQGLYLTL